MFTCLAGTHRIDSVIMHKEDLLLKPPTIYILFILYQNNIQHMYVCVYNIGI